MRVIPRFVLRWQAERDTAFVRTEIFCFSNAPVRSKAPSPLRSADAVQKGNRPCVQARLTSELTRQRFPVRSAAVSQTSRSGHATSRSGKISAALVLRTQPRSGRVAATKQNHAVPEASAPEPRYFNTK